MSKYHLVSFSLGISQLAKVRRGAKNDETIKIRVSAESIGKGHHKLALTDAQYNKLAKKEAAGLGCELTLTGKALRHAAKNGGGFLRNLAGSAVSGLGNFLGDRIKGGKLKPKKKRRGKGFLRNLAGSAVSGLGDFLGNKIKGGKLKPKKKRKGKGFLRNLAGSAVSGLGDFLGNKIKGGKLGKGILAPGYGLK